MQKLSIIKINNKINLIPNPIKLTILFAIFFLYIIIKNIIIIFFILFIYSEYYIKLYAFYIERFL